MKPLIVLLVSFVIALFTLYFIRGFYEIALPGRIAMSVMLVFTAIGHFVYTKSMMRTIPGIIPFKKVVVYVTGIFEIAAAIGFKFLWLFESQVGRCLSFLLLCFRQILMPQ